MEQTAAQSFQYPAVFWLTNLVLLGLIVEAFNRWNESWAKPAVLVYGTIGAWYIGDIVYSSPDEYGMLFSGGILQLALLQVTLFLMAYRLFVVCLLPIFVRGLPDSKAAVQFKQQMVTGLMVIVSFMWVVLFVMGLWISKWQLLAVVWPPTADEKVGMFVHPGVGSQLAFLLATGGYVYMLVCSTFGVLSVLIKGPARFWPLLLMAVSWPYFWFGTVRNSMLALLMPAVFCFWLFGKLSWKVKAIVSVLLFVFVNLWFHGVGRYRGGGESLGTIMKISEQDETKHYGLDMLKELCWVDYFIESGSYKPSMGQRYFAEVANVVPRTFWPNKPLIGVDYATLRGLGGNEESEAGIFASVATGMIGQGVLNFGRFFGVLCAAFLAAAWSGMLARLWRQRFRLPRLLLFVVGCGLTFNLGRDITLLVLWPFVFGYMGVLLWERQFGIEEGAAVASDSPGGRHRSRSRPSHRSSRSSRRMDDPVIKKNSAAPDTASPGNSEA